MEADARTTRGLIGDAESRTSAGWIWFQLQLIGLHRRISWYVLNSEYDVVKTFNMSWDITKRVSKTFDMSWNIYDSLSGKVKYAFKAAKTITEFFGDRKNSGDKKKSRMR